MTVEELISVLRTCHHKGMAQVLFERWSDDEAEHVEFDLESIGQFGVVPDVVFHLKQRP